MDLVSAIITTYKREPKIVERALKSVCNQTYKNIEIIIVDDSPTDYQDRPKIRILAEKYGVSYIAHIKSQGACVARNTGLRACNGEFIAFLDDDDEWKPDKIEKQVVCIESTQNALVYCGSETKNEISGTISPRKCHSYQGMIYDKLILENFIGSTSFPLLRTKVLREIGGFDPLMQSAQDFDVWLRIAKEYSIGYVNEPLVIYHVHDGEQISKNYQRKIAGLERIIEKNIEYLKGNRQAMWIRTMNLVPIYAGDRQILKALRIWFCAVWKCPERIIDNLHYLFSAIRMSLQF